MTTTELSPPIMTCKPLDLKHGGLIFRCVAGGHRDGNRMRIDDLTIIVVQATPFGSPMVVNMCVNDRITCEGRLFAEYPDIIIAALVAAESEQESFEACT